MKRTYYCRPNLARTEWKFELKSKGLAGRRTAMDEGARGIRPQGGRLRGAVSRRRPRLKSHLVLLTA